MTAVLSGSTPPAPSRPPLGAALPLRFGRYTLFEPIGRGGMAELYLARTETELGATRHAVVKLILPAFADDPRFSEMLIHEAKLAARLSHRHIVQVLDLGRDAPTADFETTLVTSSSTPSGDERLYIAMEYVEGFDLNALLRRCTEQGVPLPPEHALGIVADVLEGLDYAHRRTSETGVSLGIVHRDVSPSNILISYDGEVKLCDFGIAHANDLVNAEADRRGEALKGKASYMSPEHARAEALDARADVFAAGIILWELLSGRRLYRLRGDVPLLEQARRAEIPAVPARGLLDQAALERIVNRALAKNRDERYPTAAAFHRDLEAYGASAGMLASRLKLGEWIAKTFGTHAVEQRRASERRLPKSSAPPPRPSGGPKGALGQHGALGGHAASPLRDVDIPAAPRVPRELDVSRPARIVSALPSRDKEPSASRETPRAPAGQTPSPPHPSPATEGISMDSPRSTREPSSRRARGELEGATPSNEREDANARARARDDELLAWARRRGWVTFFFFLLVATSIAVVWYLGRRP